MNFLLNLAKAAVAVVVTPVDLVVDVLTLPATSYDGRDPFERTERRLEQAGRALDAAVKPE